MKENNLGRRGTNRDITERKFAEEQLRESELRFSKLYEDGPFGMAMVDADFRFKKVNPAFSAMMGYSEKELRKMTFKDITHPEDAHKDLPNVLKLINKEISVFKTEKRLYPKRWPENLGITNSHPPIITMTGVFVITWPSSKILPVANKPKKN